MEKKGRVQKLSITRRAEMGDGIEGVRNQRKGGHCVLRMDWKFQRWDTNTYIVV